MVIDILPLDKVTPPNPPPKKQGKGVFKSMFRKRGTESSTSCDKDFELDVVEEIFEEGSAVLAERFVFPAICIILMFMCQLEYKLWPLYIVV